MNHDHVSRRAGESAPFHFDDRWTVDAEPEAVWAVLEKVDDWPKWWPGLSRAHRTDEPLSVGSRATILVRTPIGVPLEFVIEASRVKAPNLIEFRADGDLRGQGLWTLTDHEGTSQIDSLWCVTTKRTGIRLLRPLAGLMHAIVMRFGERGLNSRMAAPQEP